MNDVSQVQNLTMTNINIVNVTVYGNGAAIMAGGNFYLENITFTNYGTETNLADNDYTIGAPIEIYASNSYQINIKNINHYNTIKAKKAFLWFKSLGTVSEVTYSPSVSIDGLNINAVVSNISMIYFDMVNTSVSIKNSVIQNIENLSNSAVYVTNSGDITFSNSQFINNDGTFASDIRIDSCSDCHIEVINSTFSRPFSDSSSGTLYNKESAIYLNSMGKIDSTYDNPDKLTLTN